METLNYIETMNLTDLKIAFLGYGAMIQGITRKLLDNQIIDNKKCLAVTRTGKSREKNIKFSTNHQEITQYDLIFLGYKQPDLRAEQVYENLEGKIVVSIIAGITEEEIQAKFRGAKIVRAMPNRGSVVGEGCTFLKFSRNFNEDEKVLVETFFKASGATYRVETTEEIDKGTIFSASMIGVIVFFREKIHHVLKISKDDPRVREFFYNLEKIIVELAQEVDFIRGRTAEIINQTFIGTEELIAKYKNFAEIRASVTSKNGTTQAMIEYLESHNIEHILSEIFAGNILNQESFAQLTEILNKSCQAGLKRARELAQAK